MKDGGPLATKIFKEMERIDVQLTRALTVRRNAISNTTTPSVQGMFVVFAMIHPNIDRVSTWGAWL